MNEYFSTFASGLSDVVEPALKNKIKDLDIKLVLDGLVVYGSNIESDKIKEIRFFNNSFVLLSFIQGLKTNPLPAMMKQVLQSPDSIAKVKKYMPKKNCSFRVVTSQENQLVSVDNNLLRNVEELLSQTTGLAVNRTNPDCEIWFLWRREGYGFVGLRITKTPNYEKTLYKGELRPELANLMCLIAEPKPSDVVLDPFAGYGAIPLECSKSFSVGKVIAGEKDKAVFQILQEKVNKATSEMVVGRWDALHLNSLTDNSIDKIITDPPWGFYLEQDKNLPDFYTKMLEELARVLKPYGLMVILMGQKELFEGILGKFSGLKLLEKYDILVSGKKAALYKIQKLNG